MSTAPTCVLVGPTVLVDHRWTGCYPDPMAAPSINELRKLDVETRLALVQELWDSIVDDAQRGTALSLSDEERRELDDRLREDDEDPDGAISWTEARAQLRDTP
jgi:putative addiction module component (TIGR02574 family)